MHFVDLLTSGVEIHQTLWINVAGFTVFEEARCPRCPTTHGEDFLDVIMESMGDPDALTGAPDVACPACGKSASLHEWKTVPHLGFVHLAIVFWNWPSFDSSGWRLDVPTILGNAIGHQLTQTYGHV